MGEAIIDHNKATLTIYSHFILYGGGATEEITRRVCTEVETLWNEPAGTIYLHDLHYAVRFCITGETRSSIDPMEVIANTDPRNNYFRVEDFVHGNISFVDGLGCNTGYLLTENLYEGSTTAAHEYGHTLGLDHPSNLDLRGEGVPGIMCPRGTLVDPIYQYDPSKPAGTTGGTLHPMHRRVRPEDIAALKLHRLSFSRASAIVGAFTSQYHWSHDQANP
jgi:hypothetical protein